MRLDFGGGSNLEITEPMQYVAVEPNRKYHFHAYMETRRDHHRKRDAFFDNRP